MPQETQATQATQATPFKRSRLSRGLSLRALAAKCEEAGEPVSDSQLSKIERGIYAPRPKLRAVLATVLDLDVLDLGA